MHLLVETSRCVFPYFSKLVISCHYITNHNCYERNDSLEELTKVKYFYNWDFNILRNKNPMYEIYFACANVNYIVRT